MVNRLVAFFATGDSIVSNNLVLSLYKHVNSPEARLYYSRQLYEESVHVDFYLLLLEEYVPDEAERAAAFAAVDNIPSIKMKADFAFKWIDSVASIDNIKTNEDKKQFLMNLITFAAAIEGLFFMGAFSYVFWLRSKGLFKGLGDGTNWVFRDESMHMDFAFAIVDIVRKQQPELFDKDLEQRVRQMLREAIECEMQFCKDALHFGPLGMTESDMLEFLKFCADLRLVRLGLEPEYNARNPFLFMNLQNMQSFGNFFERKIAEYNSNINGEVSLDEEF